MVENTLDLHVLCIHNELCIINWGQFLPQIVLSHEVGIKIAIP